MPGLDPKTGLPLNYNPNAAVQNYAEASHGTRAKPNSGKLCPTNNGGKNWEPSAYHPELGLLYIPSIEGCNYLELMVQEDIPNIRPAACEQLRNRATKTLVQISVH
jgi:hypothetical protein